MPERILRNRLRAGTCVGFKFRRQHPLGIDVVDFCCRVAGLAVEVDGRTHESDQNRDRARDSWLSEHGVEILRVPAWRVSQDVDSVVRQIMRRVERRLEPIKPGEFTRIVDACEQKRLKIVRTVKPSSQASPAWRGGGGRIAKE